MLKQLLILSLIVSGEAYRFSSGDLNPVNWSTSLKFAGFTGALVSSYWVVSKIHVYYCAPPGLYGLFQSALLMSSPICTTCLSILGQVEKVYSVAWAGLFFSGINLLKETSGKITGTKNIKGG